MWSLEIPMAICISGVKVRTRDDSSEGFYVTRCDSWDVFMCLFQALIGSRRPCVGLTMAESSLCACAETGHYYLEEAKMEESYCGTESIRKCGRPGYEGSEPGRRRALRGRATFM